ncbi:peptidoglycan-binding protein [Streptomyces sp. NBC_00989]|uniref:peptidoglycan-binding domain-containing protein n=1 Tax=Streptomyces sp. NBC_00989 TaxID=2903705 RepID=UPI00386FC1E3|nr:peptidoglycan-binding protein [Streptomyces sp. NBC_00989]
MSFRTQVAASVTAAFIVAGLHVNGTGPDATGWASTTVPTAPNAAVSCGRYSGEALTRRGDTGARVREVQCLLALRGWVGAGTDARYGDQVYLGVRAFQSWDDLRGCAAPLTPDGIVGPRTWGALRSADGCPTP